MPRYSSLSFQAVDAPISAADANYRIQSVFDTTISPSQNVLLVSNENVAIPLNLLLRNNASQNDNQLHFTSLDSDHRLSFGYNAGTNQHILASAGAVDLLLTNQAAQQTILLDQFGNIALTAGAGSTSSPTSVTLNAGTSSSLQLLPNALNVSTNSATFATTQDVTWNVGGNLNILNTGLMTVNGNVTFTGSSLTIPTAELVLGNGLEINGSAGLVVNGANTTSVFNGALQVNQLTSLQNTSITGTLGVSGLTTFGNNVTVTENALVQGTNGVMIANGPLAVQNPQSVSSFAGALNISGPLQVLSGALTMLSGPLTVQQATTLNGQLTVTGNGGVTVSQGPVTISAGNLILSNGSLSVQNGIGCAGGLTLTGPLMQMAGGYETNGDIQLLAGNLRIAQGTLQLSAGAGITALDVLHANAHFGATVAIDGLVTANAGLTVPAGTTTLQSTIIQGVLMTAMDTKLGGALNVKESITTMADIAGQGKLTLPGPVVVTSGTAAPSSFQAGLTSQGAIQLFGGGSSTTPLINLTVDGSRALFASGLQTSNLSLDVSAGLNVLQGNFITSSGTTAQFNGAVTTNGQVTMTNGASVSNGLFSVGAGGFSVLNGGAFTVGSTSTATMNGPLSLNAATTASGSFTSTAPVTTTSTMTAGTFSNTNNTFAVDTSGNETSQSVTTGIVTATAAQVTGNVQASTFGNTTGTFTTDTSGNVQVAAVTLAKKVPLTASPSTGAPYSVTLPITLPQSNGQALVADTNGILSWTNNIASPYPGASAFAAANNQTSSANISNLLFTSAGRSVYIEAALVSGSPSVKQKALYVLTGWKDASGDGEWHLQYYASSASGNLGLTFGIDGQSSQISYTSQNYSMFTSLTFYVTYE